MKIQVQNMLRQLPSFKRVIVGVSGGADSVCLALLLKELGYEVIVAHLNHQLRGRESDADADFVKNLAAKLRVPCVIESTNIPRKGNLEANAREIRYAFLEEVRHRMRADVIAVAHHRDDQVETVLMNLVRGAGLRGLAGMPLERNHLIRPLLGVTKKDILTFLRSRGQSFRTDKTNLDLRLLRNRLRHLVIPSFKKENPYFAEEVLEFSEQARLKLDQAAARTKNWLQVNAKNNRFSREYFLHLEPDMQGQMIIELVGGLDLYAKNINRLIRFIATGKTGKRMNLKSITFIIEYDHIRFEPKKHACCLPKKPITVQGIHWGDWAIRKKGRLKLFVRPWKPGDYFQPNGMRGNKKLQDFFVDAKIPRMERCRIPIIVNTKDEILGVGKNRLSEKGKQLKLNQKVFILES